MSSIKTSLLIAVLACVSACGRQVVEFKLDGGDGIDAPVDASIDGPPIALRPTVVSTMPVSDATGVALNTSPTATFSKPMNAGTLTTTTFTLRQGSTALVGVVTVNAAGTIATLNPTADLIAGLVYTATITTGAQDTGGLGLAADYTWMFSAAANASPPTVITTTPTPNATGVSLNVSPTATFSKAMNATTINATTFTLSRGATPVAGVVTLNSATNTATFNPAANLTAGLVYTATITTGAQDTGGLALSAPFTWMFTAGAAVLPPTVTMTTPAPNATTVALGVNLTATFSQPMNATTINATTFTLAQGATPIAGVVTYDAPTNTATFNPATDLTAGLVYTATITTGALDAGGLALAAPFTWMFTTGTVVLPPTVTVTTPAPGATNVALTVSPTATFSRAMNATTINATTFTLAQGATPIVGVVTYNAVTNTATFNPTVDLTTGLVYTATITTGAQDTNGVALAAPFTWMFTTGTSMLPPTVMTTSPLANAMNVPITVSPTATFSQPMNMLTINSTTFTLFQGLTQIAGVVTYNALTNTATFNPTVDLTTGLVYTATITTGAQDSNGMSLAAPFTWMFTTGAACIVQPIILGTSGAFAVLAGSTITNTGPSMITGDMGVYPLTAITGFPPGVLTGNQYPGIAPSDSAQGDLTIAYNDAAGRTMCLTSIVGDLGGMTLPPGLYKSTGFLSVVTADLVLDAQGDPNARWIFAMASALTVANNRQVTIIGGGSAANVFWQVGSSATLGTGSSFVGTIMADQAISFATGAVLRGRALARIAAVTLDSTTITLP